MTHEVVVADFCLSCEMYLDFVLYLWAGHHMTMCGLDVVGGYGRGVFRGVARL